MRQAGGPVIESIVDLTLVCERGQYVRGRRQRKSGNQLDGGCLIVKNLIPEAGREPDSNGHVAGCGDTLNSKSTENLTKSEREPK